MVIKEDGMIKKISYILFIFAIISVLMISGCGDGLENYKLSELSTLEVNNSNPSKDSKNGIWGTAIWGVSKWNP